MLPIRDEIVRRIELLNKADKDPFFRQVLLEKSRRDVVFWVNNFCWSYDPRVKPSLFPLRLFEFQERYLHWRQEIINQKSHGVIAKSRDMGLSWLNIMDHVHRWLFTKGFKGTFISRKESLVDKVGDTDSIFEKIRLLLRFLPKWMLPEGFKLDIHAPFCKIINPANQSLITGQAGDEAGRGGRSSISELDEYAFIPRQGKVDAAISQNSDVIFYTSTPNGIGDNFYKKFSSSAIPNFRAHWKDDPRKNLYVLSDGTEGQGWTDRKDAIYPWYEKQKATLDPVVLASEVDIDFAASIEGIFIESKWVQAAINYPTSTRGKLQAGLDVATTGKNSNVLTIGTDTKVHKILDWQGLDTTQTAHKIIEIWYELPKKERWFVVKIDGDGAGEGVLSTLRAMDSVPFEVVGLHGVATPSETEWPDGLYSHEKFANSRAEWWSILRWRIKNCYDRERGLDVDIEDCLSIPNHPTLLSQLSQPLRKYSTKKKILVESKDDMRTKRGLSSPDFADSLAYMLAPYESENFDWMSKI